MLVEKATAIGLAAVALAACSSAVATPGSVQPTLAAVGGLGYRCGAGVKDNVPSGLYQWSCGGTVGGATTTILVDGNEAGVAQVTLVVDDPRHPAAAIAEFGRLVDAAPPLDAAPVLKQAVAGWAGDPQAWTMGGVRVSGQCDATQCLLIVVGTGDPLEPLPLP